MFVIHHLMFGRWQSNSRDMQLQWEESCIPSTYIASNGPCRIAAIGKDDGQSIAVAASCGLCILDLSRLKRQEKRTNTIDKKNTPCVEGQPCIESATPNPVPSHFPRWKLFSNVRDEQSFRVLGMVWWERCSSATRTKDDASDDLLLAVIQYSAGDSTPYLVCWSRKR